MDEITLQEERLTAECYREFLSRTDLGSQYPAERFETRIGKLVQNASLSLTARTGAGELVGVAFGITDFAYWLFVTDLGVDRSWLRRGIGTALLRELHRLAGGQQDIALYLCANEAAVPFYEKLGLERSGDVMALNHIQWTPFTVTRAETT